MRTTTIHTRRVYAHDAYASHTYHCFTSPLPFFLSHVFDDLSSSSLALVLSRASNTEPAPTGPVPGGGTGGSERQQSVPSSSQYHTGDSAVAPASSRSAAPTVARTQPSPAARRGAPGRRVDVIHRRRLYGKSHKSV